MEVLDNLTEENNPRYAGFWIRFVAVFIDGIILSVFLGPLFFFLYWPGDGFARLGEDPSALMAFYGTLGSFYLIEFVVYIAYYAGLESSKYQATLGKMAVGIIVINESGNRISFGRAVGRLLSKILSGLILYIGFIMAGFDSRKQALHDKIASTFVIYKN